MCGEKWLGERAGEKGGADGAVTRVMRTYSANSKQERVLEGETGRQDGKEWKAGEFGWSGSRENGTGAEPGW